MSLADLQKSILDALDGATAFAQPFDVIFEVEDDGTILLNLYADANHTEYVGTIVTDTTDFIAPAEAAESSAHNEAVDTMLEELGIER